MKITPMVRRSMQAASCLLLALVVAACSRSTSQPYQTAQDYPEDQMMAAEEAADSATWDSQLDSGGEVATTQTIASVEQEGLGIELFQKPNGTSLVLRPGVNQFDYDVSRLDGPPRLVFDIDDGGQRLSRVFEVQNDPYVEKIRVGAHPDKSRIVLDLNPNADALSFDTEAVAGQLFVNFVGQGNQPMEKAEMMEEPMESQATEQDQMAQDQMAMAENNPAPAGPSLEAIEIDQTGDSENALIAQMNAAGFFTFERTAPSEYVLRLEGAQFDPSLVGTIIAPPKSGAIRSVRPVSDGDDTLLRIFTEPSKKLSATTKGNKIMVKEDFFQLASDAKAQAEVKEEEAAAEDADVELLEEVDEAELGDLDSVAALLDEQPKYTGRQISLDLQDTDIDNALRIIAEVS